LFCNFHFSFSHSLSLSVFLLHVSERRSMNKMSYLFVEDQTTHLSF
jgi:hypothetical protein